MKQPLYFAFGSNLDKKRLIERVGWCKTVKAIKVKQYKLVFNINGFANMQFTGNDNDFVEGVLYALDHDQLHTLDRYEGLYERYYFTIADGTLVCTYLGRNWKTISADWIPDLKYLNLIIDACFRLGFKDTYNKLVQYKIDNYALKKGNRHKFID